MNASPVAAKMMNGQIVFLRFTLCSGRFKMFMGESIAKLNNPKKSISIIFPPESVERILAISKYVKFIDIED